MNTGGAGELDKEHAIWLQLVEVNHFLGQGGYVYHDATVNGIVEGGLSITYQEDERIIPCEAVVEGYDMLPNTALADEVAAAGYEVHVVGKANEPGTIGMAIGNANVLARTL